MRRGLLRTFWRLLRAVLAALTVPARNCGKAARAVHRQPQAAFRLDRLQNIAVRTLVFAGGGGFDSLGAAFRYNDRDPVVVRLCVLVYSLITCRHGRPPFLLAALYHNCDCNTTGKT